MPEKEKATENGSVEVSRLEASPGVSGGKEVLALGRRGLSKSPVGTARRVRRTPDDRTVLAGGGTGGESAASPSSLNGFGVADWLLEPLLLVAADGLEFLQRNEAPPRLVPLVGKRLRKLGKPERETILAALGQHRRFTEVIVDMFRSVHVGCFAPYEQLSTKEIIDDLRQGSGDAPHVVSILLAWDRVEDALEVSTWAEEDPEPDELEGLIGALARESWNSQEEVRRLGRDLATERRTTKRLERRLGKASQTLEEKAKEAAEAAKRARSLQEECATVRAREQGLVTRMAELEEAEEISRRERRDLRAELEDLQERYRRVRRELKEARARLPAPETLGGRSEGGRARAAPRGRPAPTPSELRDRFVEDGARGVLEAKRILLLVDGWNVSLGHIGAERLQDKRR
ncbi:MAG: hypothetical protein ACRDJK_06310, partial [Actinomycetota bacterium]